LERSLERGRRSPAGTPSANANHPPARIAAGGTPIGQPSGREIEPANDDGKVWGIREEREEQQKGGGGRKVAFRSDKHTKLTYAL